MTTLEQAAANVILKATEATSTAIDFVTGQLPEIVRQYLQFQLYWNIFIVSVSLLVILAFLLNIKRIHKYDSTLNIKDQGGVLFAFWGIFVLTSLLTLPMIVLSIKEILMISLAPKVYIIQWASSLVK